MGNQKSIWALFWCCLISPFYPLRPLKIKRTIQPKHTNAHRCSFMKINIITFFFFYQIHSPDDVWPGGVHFWCWGGQTAGLPVSLWQVHISPIDKFETLKLNLKQGMLYHFSDLQKRKLINQNTKRIVELSPSYKNFPSNLEVIDWLGSYFIEMQVPSFLLTW